MKTGDGMKCFLKDKDNNGFTYVKPGSGLEKKIFKVYDKKDMSFPIQTMAL